MILLKLLDAFPIYSFGLILGTVLPMIYGYMGGDEQFQDSRLKPFLKLLHHWQIGAIVMMIGAYTHPFILGWGTGTALDDLLFHSFERYFRRINGEK